MLEVAIMVEGQEGVQSVLAGTADEIVERLGRLSEAGVQWVMLQWLEVDDIYALEAMACSVLPQLRL